MFNIIKILNNYYITDNKSHKKTPEFTGNCDGVICYISMLRLENPAVKINYAAKTINHELLLETL